jgi:hypothetical protein
VGLDTVTGATRNTPPNDWLRQGSTLFYRAKHYLPARWALFRSVIIVSIGIYVGEIFLFPIIKDTKAFGVSGIQLPFVFKKTIENDQLCSSSKIIQISICKCFRQQTFWDVSYRTTPLRSGNNQRTSCIDNGIKYWRNWQSWRLQSAFQLSFPQYSSGSTSIDELKIDSGGGIAQSRAYQINSSNVKEWPFQANGSIGGFCCGLGGLFGGIGRYRSNVVGSNQEVDLKERNNYERAREESQYESKERNRINPSSLPQIREPIPPGFGWLVLIAAGMGLLAGAAIFGLLWLIGRP